MTKMPAHKYRQFPTVELPDRQWPSQVICAAPRWCSVDLRDGNQALSEPMALAEKLQLFRLLVDIGFTEIEVGFPAASQTEFDFLRLLIEQGLIPDGVTIQVLTQAREHLVKRTFEALAGARRAIVHLYNSTSELQRRVVFRMDKREIIAVARKGAELAQEQAATMEDAVIDYEYSPESFSGTELDFAVEVCEAVMDVWQPSKDRKVILNLPGTVEMATPNVYADQIEWFCSHLRHRENAVISTHAHNDRGTAVAATELALMAGADRVEGTLFGNGERTGNVDLVTVALNMFSQGIDPMLDFSDINRVIGLYEKCTKMPVHARHPYAGELVYTAFSGSHQDAINKGMKVYKQEQPHYWEVPYLPIDPADVGRTFESIIRINSQSGKGGVAYVMEKEFDLCLPKAMHPEFGKVVQAIADRTGSELTPGMIRDAFEREYLLRNEPLSFVSCRTTADDLDDGDHPLTVTVTARLRLDGALREVSGRGNGPIDAFTKALRELVPFDFALTSYFEHALTEGSDSKAVAYMQVRQGQGTAFWGVGIDTSIETASFRALISGLDRAIAAGMSETGEPR